MSVKETVDRFTIYQPDIKDDDADKGKRYFWVLGTRLVIERGNEGQTIKRKNKVSRLVWQTKRSLRQRSPQVVETRKKDVEDLPESEAKKTIVKVVKEHPGTFRKHKTRALETVLSASTQGKSLEESSEYNASSPENMRKKRRKETETETLSPSDELTSKDVTPRQGRKSTVKLDVRGEESDSWSSSSSSSDDEIERLKSRKHQSLPEKPVKKHTVKEAKRHKSLPSEMPYSRSRSSSDIDVGDTGIGDCADEEHLIRSRKKHESVIWSPEQKKVFYSSFARKSHDYSVFISPDEAFKRAKELNVYDPNDDTKVYVSCPVFKVLASPTQMMGKECFSIRAIKKIYFQDRAGHVQAGMLDVIYHDNSNSDPGDFVFDAEQIRDNIVPPVKIRQDLKIPMIIGAVTTLLQVLQVVVSYYLTTGINKDSSA